MKKLTREELKNVKGGMGVPPGGGGSTLCNFVSANCGNMCFDISGPGPFPPVSSCGAYLAYLNPSCGYTAQAVTKCPVQQF